MTPALNLAIPVFGIGTEFAYSRQWKSIFDIVKKEQSLTMNVWTCFVIEYKKNVQKEVYT